MAVGSGTYSLERYLVAGAVIADINQRVLSINDIDMTAQVDQSLEPEIESMRVMGVLESYYSPVDQEKKYRVADEHFGDFRKVYTYFRDVYAENYALALHDFDEADRENLEAESDIVDLLS